MRPVPYYVICVVCAHVYLLLVLAVCIQCGAYILIALSGENNGANPGDFSRQEGYGCLLPQMVSSWRREFSTYGAR